MKNLDFKTKNVYQAKRTKKKVLLSVLEPVGGLVEQGVIGEAQNIDPGLTYNFKNGISKVEFRFTSEEKAREFKKYIDTGSKFSPFEKFVISWTRKISNSK